MPSSSVLSHNSSVGSRRGRDSKYRTVSQKSQVDENLFGESFASKRRQETQKQPPAEEVVIEQQAAQRSAGRKQNGKPKKETVTVITKDLIRNLVVPKEDPSGMSCILSYTDYLRLKGRSRFQTKEEEEQIREMQNRQKEDEIDAVHQRKELLHQHDLARRKNEKLSDLEEEAKQKAEHLLQKAMRQRQDQEDEIKRLNELILNAKCHAIRDAQIMERDQIKQELAEDDKRLDVMMEVDRRNALVIQEEIEKKRRQEEMIGASKIIDQIHENEQERLLELEKKDQENMAMQKYLEKLMWEEKEKLERKHAEQTSLREQLNLANDDIMRRRGLLKEQDKALEAKVLQFQREKAEREAAYEQEQERIKQEKEKEVARLRALQERASDEQAERDALRAQRATEQAEREWRKKEADEAVQKAMTEAELKIARAQQMNQKEHFLAVQAARERAEFERVLKAQKELIEKERKEETEVHAKRSQYGTEIKKQIQLKEQQQIRARNAFFEEGVKMEEEARLRRAKLEEAKNRKLVELRNAGIPEKYLAQVERKIQQPQHISS